MQEMRDRYVFDGILGCGGMATVYRAYDRSLGVTRAVKQMSPGIARNAEQRVRFENEARTMARLRHPNILCVHDFGVEGDIPFIVSDLARGGCLVDHLDSGPLRAGVACDVIIAVLSALHYAHDNGVVHRDVKPQNVLLDQNGVPLLADFGIARVVGADSQTQNGSTMGTMGFMAPEQRGDPLASGVQVDRRADVYAAGVTLYVLLTGYDPGPGPDAAHRPDLELAEVDDALASIIRVATSHSPEDRYQSAADMRAALMTTRARFPHEDPGVLRPAEAIPDAERLPRIAPPSRASHPTAVARESTITPPRSTALTSPWPRWWPALAAGVLGVAGAAAAYTLEGHAGPVAAGVQVSVVPGSGVPSVVIPTPPPVAAEVSVGPISPASPAPPAIQPTRRAPAPATANPAAVAPALQASGTVAINSLPWSTISIDGQGAGRTGWTGDLPAGTHELRLVSSDGQTMRRILTVASGVRSTFCWDFHTGAACQR